MSMERPDHSAGASPSALKRIDTICLRFEGVWQAGGCPQIAEFLAAADGVRLERLFLELMLVDLEYRWRQNVSASAPTTSLSNRETSSSESERQLPPKPLVEDYLRTFPEYGSIDGLSDEVLAEEYRVRRLWGDCPGHEQFQRRFPRRRGLVEALQAVDEELLTSDRTADRRKDAGEAHAISVEQFLARLTKSRLIADEEVRQLHEQQQKNPWRDVPSLVEKLVAKGQLTRFQAQSILCGSLDQLAIGNYIVLDRLGHGGMGQVFRARHRRMDRIVAVKVLAPWLTDDAMAVKRFHREVKLAAKLVHPNIALAHDADEADGKHFLVMQYVDGQDLDAVVREGGPLSVSRAVEVLTQAARGLEYAHREGVVHRDVKPSNLMLDSSGTLKILDLGLARLNEPGQSQPSPSDAGLSATHQALGTVDFMAPEQAGSQGKADQRSDIYSLGCTLHQLLLGVRSIRRIRCSPR